MNKNQSKATSSASSMAGSVNTKRGRSGPAPAKQGTRSNRAPDAIALLTEDHKRVQQMFKDFEALGDATSSKRELANKICAELTIHTAIEEEIFYPAAREAIDDDDLMDEADVEHAAAKELIAQIEEMDADESHYDAKVKVLGEEVEHHIKEEQDGMFAKIRKSDLDVKALGQAMADRKAELQRESNQQ